MRQSQSGVIAFYSEAGHFLYERKYDRISQRQEIIGFARKLYGKMFQRMFYQINPHIRPDQDEKAIIQRYQKKAA